MGEVSFLKADCNLSLIVMLLKISDEDDVYDISMWQQAHQMMGCKGVHFGGKYHIIDAMEILLVIWSKN